MRVLNPRRSRWHSFRGGLSLVCLLSLVALLVPAGVSAGGDTGVGQPIGTVSLLQPFANSLSASSWTMIEGYDPRIQPVPTERNVSAFAQSILAPGQGRGGSAQAAAAPLVPFRNPAPSFSRNLIVTRQVGLFPIQTEPSIAVDPTDPEHIVLGTIDYNFPGLSVYVSNDAGQTWDGPHQIRYFDDDLTAAGDPVVAFGSDGTVYIASISLGLQEFTIGTLVSDTEVSSIVVSHSEDGGITWSDAVSASRSQVVTHSQPDSSGKERGTIDGGFLDKPWLTVGPSKSDPSQDELYLSYTNFDTQYTIIYADEVPFLTSPSTQATIQVVHSSDGGSTWSTPANVSPTVLQVAGASKPGEGPGGDSQQSGSQPLAARQALQALQQQASVDIGANRTVQGSQPKVLKDGTVVVAYLDTTNDGVQTGLDAIMVTESHDGGKTWTSPVQAGLFRELPFSPRNSFFRYWGAAFPQLAVGPKDEIYILTTALPPDKPTDNGDIYLMRSLDGGKTWKTPLRVNQDKTDRLQFFPSITVSPDGTVHAMWGDMRDDPMEVRYNIYYSKSTDEGATWGFPSPEQHITLPDARVTDFASNSLKGFPNGAFLGDYFSIAATNNNVFMVWADTRLGEYAGPQQQIGFARESAIKPPQLFLNPASGTAGRDVTIQGFDFQPQSNVVITVGGVNYSNVRTDDNGGFQTDVFMPVTGEGAQQIQAFDETGNVATTSFYTSFGFDTIQKALAQLGAATPSPLPPSAPASASPVAAPAGTPAAAAPAAPMASAPIATGVSSLGDFALLGGAGGLALAALAYGGLERKRRRRA